MFLGDIVGHLSVPREKPCVPRSLLSSALSAVATKVDERVAVIITTCFAPCVDCEYVESTAGNSDPELSRRTSVLTTIVNEAAIRNARGNQPRAARFSRMKFSFFT